MAANFFSYMKNIHLISILVNKKFLQFWKNETELSDKFTTINSKFQNASVKL